MLLTPVATIVTVSSVVEAEPESASASFVPWAIAVPPGRRLAAAARVVAVSLAIRSGVPQAQLHRFVMARHCNRYDSLYKDHTEGWRPYEEF